MEVAKHWRETPERYRMEAEKCSKCGMKHAAKTPWSMKGHIRGAGGSE